MDALAIDINSLGKPFFALDWWDLQIYILVLFMGLIIIKTLLHMVSHSGEYYYFSLFDSLFSGEVVSYALASAIVCFIPWGWASLLVIASCLAGWGAFLRQHSRYIIITKSDRYRTVTRPKDTTVGLSDVLLIAFAVVLLRHFQQGEEALSSWLILALQLPILVGLYIAFLSFKDVGPREVSHDEDSSAYISDRKRKRLLVKHVTDIVAKKLNFIELLLMVNLAPVLALLLGKNPSGPLLAAGLLAMAVTCLALFLPAIYQKNIVSALRAAIKNKDIEKLLQLRGSEKVGEQAEKVLRELIENDAEAADKAFAIIKAENLDKKDFWAWLKFLSNRKNAGNYSNRYVAIIKNQEIPLEKRQRVIPALSIDMSRKVLLDLGNEFFLGFLRELDDKQYTYLRGNLNSVLYAFVKEEHARGNQPRQLRVENLELITQIMSMAADTSRSAWFRAVIIQALADVDRAQMIPDCQKAIAAVKNDAEVTEILKTWNLKFK